MRDIRRLIYPWLVVLALWSVDALAEEPASLTEFVRTRLVAHAFSRMKNFQICEAFSASDRRAFFDKALAVDVFSEAEFFQSKELFLLDDATPEHRLHLGVLALRYGDGATARRIEDALRKQQILRHMIVLTKVLSVAVANSVVVIYSETAASEPIKSFLEKIPGEIMATAPSGGR